MRTEWPQMPEVNKIELQHVIHILQKLMHFDRAILYGHYAGGRMRSELRGYELLLVTCGTPEKEGWELEAQLKQYFLYEIREEPNIHIETACISDINDIGTKSWYYTYIRNEGVILYDNNQAQPFFSKSIFKYTAAYYSTLKRYNYFFGIGSDLLNEAERLWNDNKSQMASIQLSYAGLFLLRAQESEFYGNNIGTSNLKAIFKRCRHFSRELLAEFDLKDDRIVGFFRELTELRRKPHRDYHYQLNKHNYEIILRRLRVLQGLVRQSCERHQFFLEHGKSEKQMKLEAEALAARQPEPPQAVTSVSTESPDAESAETPTIT